MKIFFKKLKATYIQALACHIEKENLKKKKKSFSCLLIDK